MRPLNLARAGVGAAIAAVLAVTGVVAAPPALATPNVQTPRLAGTDRFATSAEVSEATFPQGASSVVVASGFSFADGLAAAALAGDLDAPVLLVPPAGPLPTSIRNELSRLGARSARIIGGVGAVSRAVADELEQRGLTVARSGGDTRYDTAALVASRIGAARVGVFDGLRTAIVATGRSFPDALAASAPAFSGPHPILLTERDQLPAATRDALDDLGVQQVIVMGGTAAVSTAVLDDIRSTGDVVRVVRVAGADRGETARQLADLLVAEAPDGFGYDTSGAVVVSGEDFADALAAGPLAGGTRAPILFASPSTTAAAAFLAAHKATIGTLTVVGGSAAVTSQQVSTLASAATQPSNQTYAMTPQSAIRRTSVAYNASNPSTYVEYRATGIPSKASPVSIALVDPANVSVTSGGIVTFAKASGTPVRADLSNARVGDLRIQSVNGTAISPSTTASATVRDGAVSFRVAVSTDSSLGEAFPVLYAPSSGNLLVGNDGRPIGGFAIGGEIEMVPPEATVPSSVTVTVHSIGDDSFVGALTPTTGRTFHLRSGDDYRIGGGGGTSNANRNAFLSALSVGDTVVVQYNQQRSHTGQQVDNVFNLTDDRVAAPTNVAAALVDSDGSGTSDTVRITFAAPRTGLQTASGATVRRYPVTNGVVGSTSTDTVVSWSYTSGSNGQLTLTGSSFPPIGTYVFRIALKGVVGSSFGALSSATGNVQVTTTPLFGSAAAPFANTIAVSDSGSNGLSSGDVITVTFSEPIQLTSGTDSITIADGDTSGTLTEGVNATFTVGGGDANVLTIAVTGPPTLAPPAGNVAYGASTKITAVSGTIRDRDASLAWDPTAANKLGQGGLPLGVSTVPGSTPVPPFTLTATADAVGSTGTITLNPVTRVITGAPGAAVPGATVFVSSITNGTAVDAVAATRRSTVAASNGSFAITLTTAQSNTTVNLRQEVQRTATTMLQSDPSAALAAQPVLLATSALGGNDGEVEDGDTIVLQLSAAVPTAGLTSFDVVIDNGTPNVITIRKAGDATPAGVVATVTTTGVRYNTGATTMTFLASPGVWTNGSKTLTITLDNRAGGTAATGVAAHTSTYAAGPALRDAVGVSIDATPVTGASSRF